MALKYGSSTRKPGKPMTPRQRLASSINFLLFATKGAKGTLSSAYYRADASHGRVCDVEQTWIQGVTPEVAELNNIKTAFEDAYRGLVKLEAAVQQYNKSRKDKEES